MLLKWIARKLFRRAGREILSQTLDKDNVTREVTSTGSEWRKQSPSRSLFRWSYILTRGVLAGIVWAFLAFCFDPLLRFGLVTALQQNVGAKAEITSLSSSFIPPTIAMDRVRLANPSKPGTNLLEFAEFRGELDGNALLRRAVVVREGTITGLRWGTARDDSGLLDGVPESENVSGGPQLTSGLERLGKGWANDLFKRTQQELDPNNLETVQLSRQLKVEWQQDLDTLESRVKQLQPQIDRIQDEAEQARREGNVLEQIEAYRTVAGDANRLLSELGNLRRATQTLPDKARNDLKQLDAAKERDQQSLRKKVDLVKLDPDELSSFLLGPRLNHYVSKALDWVRWSRSRRQALSQKPQRSRGKTISFPRSDHLPDFLVQRLHISGEGEFGNQRIAFRGTISDITSDPKTYGRPTVIQLVGTGDAEVEVQWTVDQTGTPMSQHMIVTFTKQTTTNLRLGNPETFALAVAGQDLRWRLDLTIVGDAMNGLWTLRDAPVTVTPQLAPNRKANDLDRLLSDIAGEIESVEAEVVIGGQLDAPTLALHSNLGPTLAAGLRQSAERQLVAQQQRLTAQLNNRVTQELNGFQSLIGERYSRLVNGLGNNEKLVRGVLSRVSRLPNGLNRLLRR